MPVSKLKEKNHTIIAIDAKKEPDNAQHTFHDKNSQQTGIEENWLNLIKKKSTKELTANIIPNGEKTDTFPLRLETRDKCSLPPLLLNVTLDVPANAVRKGNKRYADCKGRNKTIFVCRKHNCLGRRCHKELEKKKKKNSWN